MIIPGAVRTDELKGSEPIPEASYNFRIEKAEYVDITSPQYKGSGKNNFISAQFVVTGPAENEQYIGRKVFMNLPLGGDGAFRTKDLLKILGIDELVDTNQLVNAEVGGVTTIRPGAEGYDPKAEIKKFMPVF